MNAMFKPGDLVRYKVDGEIYTVDMVEFHPKVYDHGEFRPYWCYVLKEFKNQLPITEDFLEPFIPAKIPPMTEDELLELWEAVV